MLYNAGNEILLIPAGVLLYIYICVYIYIHIYIYIYMRAHIFPVYVIEIENQFITPMAVLDRVYAFLHNYHVTLISLQLLINRLSQI